MADRHKYPYDYRTVKMPDEKNALRLCQQTDIVLKPHTDMISCAWRREEADEWIMAVVGYGSPIVWEVIDRALAHYPQVQVSSEELGKAIGKVIDQGDDVLIVPEPEQLWMIARLLPNRDAARRFMDGLQGVIRNDALDVGSMVFRREGGESMGEAAVVTFGHPDTSTQQEIEQYYGPDLFQLSAEERQQVLDIVEKEVREAQAKTGNDRISIEKHYAQEEEKLLFVRARLYPDKPSGSLFFAELVAIVGKSLNIGVVELDRASGEVLVVAMGYPPPDVQRQLEQIYGANHTLLTEHEMQSVKRIVLAEIQESAKSGQSAINVTREYAPTSDPAKGITLDLRTPEMKASGHGYTVSYGPDGVQMGEVGKKPLPTQKLGQPFIAFVQDVMRLQEDQMMLDTTDVLRHKGVTADHLRDYVRFTIGADIGHLRRSDMYQFTPVAVNLLDTVLPGNSTDWIKRTRSLWIMMEEPITVKDSPPLKAVWLRAPVRFDYFQARAANYKHANPLINALEEQVREKPEGLEPWQIVIYGLDGQDYLIYEYDGQVQEWRSTLDNVCPQNLCDPESLCAFCQDRAEHWARWIHTVQRILHRDYGVGPLEVEDKPFPEITETWTEKKQVVVGSGKNKHKVLKDVPHDETYKLVTFDVTIPPQKTATRPSDSEPEHTGNWMTWARENGHEPIWEVKTIRATKRHLKPLQEGEDERIIDIPSFPRRVYYLAPEHRKSSQVIKRVTAQGWKKLGDDDKDEH